MSLPSWYGEDPEVELEFWPNLINPSYLPSADDNRVAQQEQAHLEADDYQNIQDKIDEEKTPSAETADLVNQLVKLPPQDLEAVIRQVTENRDAQK